MSRLPRPCASISTRPRSCTGTDCCRCSNRSTASQRKTCAPGTVEATRAQRFRTDDRLVKTLILSSLADGVEALRALTPSRLAALNHGTVRSPIPGQESQIVLHKCRNWAAQVGEIKISDDGPNPVISFHLAGVDTEGILANAQSIDNYGNRIHKARSLFYDQLGLKPRMAGSCRCATRCSGAGTWRTCEMLFRNVRELSLESFKAPGGAVADRRSIFPLTATATPPRTTARSCRNFRRLASRRNCLVWLPAFFTPRTMEDLGRLVILDYVLSGNNLNQCGSHLSQIEREQARVLLQNQRDQMRQRLRNAMLAAYGVSTMYTEAIDTSHDLGGAFLFAQSRADPATAGGRHSQRRPAPPVRPGPGAPVSGPSPFRRGSKAIWPQTRAGVVRQATQVRDGRVEVERSKRDEVRRIAVPLHLGDMGETHFVVRDEWKSRFLRKQAEEGAPA